MEPISTSIMLALAGGAAGEIGRQAWVGLRNLIRRPTETHNETSQIESGEADFLALERTPDDMHARKLVETLSRRAAADPAFNEDLQTWYESAQLIQTRTGDGNVTNSISGGTFSGPVISGRDFSNITFGNAPNATGSPSTSKGDEAHDR